jgi:hypothetical protein
VTGQPIRIAEPVNPRSANRAPLGPQPSLQLGDRDFPTLHLIRD